MNIKYDIFLSLSCTPHTSLTMNPSAPRNISTSLSFRHHAYFIQYCWPYVSPMNGRFLILKKSPAIQQLTAIHKLNPPTTCSGSHSSLTSTTCTQPVTKMCEFSITVSTSSHNVSSCFTASPIFPSHFLHVQLVESLGVTLFILAYQPLIHLLHCAHNAEIAFALKLQKPHGSTLHLDKSSCVMPLQTNTLIFPRITFKPSLLIAKYHFKNSYLSPSIVSLMWTVISIQ